MKKNMGTTDKIVRVVLAIVIAGLYLLNIISGTFAVVAGIIAAIFLFTSSVSFCPLYAPFGVKTCKVEKQEA